MTETTKSRTVTVRLPQALYDELARLAEKQSRTVSAMAAICVSRGVTQIAGRPLPPEAKLHPAPHPPRPRRGERQSA